jgi:hypothetical protein
MTPEPFSFEAHAKDEDPVTSLGKDLAKALRDNYQYFQQLCLTQALLDPDQLKMLMSVNRLIATADEALLWDIALEWYSSVVGKIGVTKVDGAD